MRKYLAFTLISMIISCTAALAGIHVDLRHPLHPVTVDPIPVPGLHGTTITPPTPGPTPTVGAIHIEGNGEGAKVLNKTSEVAGAPEQAIQKITAGIDHSVEQMTADLGNALTKPFRDIGDWFKRIFAQSEEAIKNFGAQAIIWLAIGLFATIALSVVISSVVVALILRRRQPRRRLTPAE
ncbi:MAG: hypothetical protein P4M15_03630 [Alphaproteobacteria bacterium]|nr:hypothetical protein [Alphaproteobacteria bacterium]